MIKESIHAVEKFFCSKLRWNRQARHADFVRKPIDSLRLILGIDNKIDFIRKYARDVADDVTSQEVDDHISLRRSKDELRGADRGRNVDDRFCSNVADCVAWQQGMAFSFLLCVGENLLRLLVIDPFPLPIFQCQHRLLPDKKQV